MINSNNNKVNVLLQQTLAFFQQGELIKAQTCATRLLELSPGHAGAIQLLGGIKTQLGDYQAAEKLFSTAIVNNPDMPGNYNNLGYVYHMMGRLEEARKTCLRAIQLKHDFAEAHSTLAVILKDLGQLEQAHAAIQRAIELKPDLIEAQNTLAAVLAELGRFDEALTVCRRALQLRPDFAEVHNILVIVLIRLGRLDEAEMACNQAIRLRPDSAALYDTRGNLLSEQGKMQGALSAYNIAIEMNPENAAGYYNRANVLGNLGRFDEAEKDYRKAMSLYPQHADAHSNLLFVQASAARLSYHEMFEEQQQWDRVHGEQGRLNAFATKPIKKKEGERLRIGYITADFCMHPVSYFFEPLLAWHDRAKVELFCYANMFESQADEVTLRLRDRADHWRYVRDTGDKELAGMIQQDSIDILIDLAGHTRGNRLKVFTYRPSPVQAMYLGYCASSGLESMDYWITDEVLHPYNTHELSTEKIIRLPRCSFSYQPPTEADKQVLRADNVSGIVFASYSHFSKLLSPVIETWSKILTEVPRSRLAIMDKYMADEGTRKILIEQFRLSGIDEERLIISGHVSYADYYASYSNVDIVLDPFPRTGGTTTADALWMGVPVITLAGGRFVERISASKLYAVNLEELVAVDREQYVSIAVKLAADDTYRRHLRDNLRDRMVHSELCDGRGLASAMEEVYGEMYARFAE